MNSQTPLLSVIIPVYNEEHSLEECYTRIKRVMEKIGDSYEILFVNDGSDDASEEKIQALSVKDLSVKLLSFSRNFGHQIAITAGIDYAAGQAVIVLDADLQDPPEMMEEMVKLWKEGYQVVYAKRDKRLGESFFKRASASLFYRLLRQLAQTPIPLDAGDFRLMDREVVEVLKEMRERNRFVRGLVAWAGFRQIGITFVRQKRYAGETKYSLRKMLSFALSAVISFSYIPLRLATYLGLLTSLGGFLYLMVVIYRHLFTTHTVSTISSLLAVNLFLTGIVLLMLGVMGEYIGRIFTECKKRPLYIVAKQIGWEKKASSFKKPS